MASVGPRLGRELSFTGRIWKAFHEWYIYACGYRQLGLRRGDLLNEDDPDVKEAVKRLSPEDFNLRQFRIKRALDLTMKHSILPKEHWTTSEEDTMYIQPLIDQVKKERIERQMWDHK
ncbi:cytochrome b-c1 complex subunit 7-like [Stylophora pistillata]|uniref:cytochrome b-c1 complex subunit 7-like n=1 Tax=Stylophora pistillata TaxID=50429 RepID=UPI000C04B087|nr:cytochrome b-c1 complex subunit 7-like [Stylophora pistillata]